MLPSTLSRCLAVVGALVLASAPQAQGSAGTSAERVAAALHTAEYADPVSIRAGMLVDFLSRYGGPEPESNAWPSADVVRDSVAAALRADLRPDLLAAALDHLESPAHQRFHDRARVNAPTLERAFSPPDDRLPSADSTLAERYAAATEAAPRLSALLAQSTRAVFLALAQESGRASAGSLGLLEELGDSASEFADEEARIQRSVALVAMAGVAAADVEAEIAFSESPPGRYVRAAQDAGLAAAYSPVVDCWSGAVAQPGPTCGR